MRISASAPGKLVLLGEYAVLAGAPALVLAVNRRARVTLVTLAGGSWEVVSPTLGLEASLRIASGSIEWHAPPPAELAWLAPLFEHLPFAPALAPCRIELDSDPFHLGQAGTQVKLGLGSSAALSVALLGALHVLGQQAPPDLAACTAVHRAIQHGRGSGIDIAASLCGGLSRFQLDGGGARIAPAMLPDGLHWCCVYSGRPASTGAMLAAIAAWREREPGAFARLIHGLATISSRGIDALAANDAAAFLCSLHDYATALARFGETAGVDIASREHRALAALAADCGCIYKSCGAGGGDVGITLAVEDTRLREFRTRAARGGFAVVELQAEQEGLTVASKNI